MNVKLISITPDYMELLKAACRQPYGKDVTSLSVKKIIESGHLSILEHCYASFEIQCSVRVLGQLTRHRHLSFTVRSARGSIFDKVVIPEGMYKFAAQRGISRERLDKLCANHSMLESYHDAVVDGLAEEDAAYWLPQGVETSMVVTGNFRAWYEYLPKRLCHRAMPEHRELAKLIQEELVNAAPAIFDRNFMNCKECKERSCDFK